MKVWKVEIRAKNKWGKVNSYTYLGVAKTADVAIRQTRRLAKKDFICIKIESVECLGDLDFCTKR